MKKLIISILLFTFLNVNAQQFTRILTGPLVNDGRYSEGAVWFDLNTDRLPDMFVSNITNQNNALYKNTGNNIFTEILTGQIVTDGGFSYGSTIGDFDNDGDEDIFVINGGGSANQFNFFYLNNGNETFSKVTTGIFVNEIGSTWGVSSVDYDNDGNLDIYTANFNKKNFLYKGNGDTTFTKITTGDIVNDIFGSINPSWCDYDNDGDADLFVATSNFGAGQKNFFYENNGDGTFTKITTGDFVNDIGNSTGASWGDYNNDGWFDLLVTNYNSENEFLYRNNGDKTFTKITTGDVVSSGGASVGSSWGDYDNDGDIDLIVSNDNNQNEFLFTNNGDGTFTRITSGDPVDDAGRSNAAVWGDTDRDGDLDLFICNGNQPTPQNNFFYINNGNSNSWVNIKLIGTQSNISAIGTRISVKSVINGSPIWQHREVQGQTGYNGQNSLEQEFGLGNSTLIDSIIIKWPSGNQDVFSGVQINKFYTVTEQGSIIGINLYNNNLPSKFMLYQNFPNPFNPETSIKYSVPKTGNVKLSVFSSSGKLMRTLVNSNHSPGEYTANFKADGLSSGIYFYRLESEGINITNKMAVVK